MSVLYIREQGAQVIRKHEQICVRLKDKTLHQTSVRELDQVVVYGNVQVTTQAAALLARHAVDVVFYSTTGRFRYRLQKNGARYARLRLAQLRIADDARRSLKIAKAIIAGKIRNQMQLVRVWSHHEKALQRHHYRQSLSHMESMLKQSQRAANVDELRGFEGKAAHVYFSMMRSLIPPRWGFQQRAYHPPPDPWNATLSFGYSLLLKDVLAAIELVGLDPYVGVFHALEANKPALALDLMEEFRPLVDDAMVRLLISGRLPLARYRIRPRGNSSVEIGSDLLPVVIEGYEKALTALLNPHQSGLAPGRQVMQRQARQMAEVMLEQRPNYQPFPIHFPPLKSPR